jgi:hypothetical protein
VITDIEDLQALAQEQIEIERNGMARSNTCLSGCETKSRFAV